VSDGRVKWTDANGQRAPRRVWSVRRWSISSFNSVVSYSLHVTSPTDTAALLLPAQLGPPLLYIPRPHRPTVPVILGGLSMDWTGQRSTDQYRRLALGHAARPSLRHRSPSFIDPSIYSKDAGRPAEHYLCQSPGCTSVPPL